MEQVGTERIAGAHVGTPALPRARGAEQVAEEMSAAPVARESTERIRISLDVTPQMKQIIDQLAEQLGTSQADVLRRAVGLLKVIKDAQARGEQPALIDEQSRTLTALIVGV
jgi:hypothetical protein